MMVGDMGDSVNGKNALNTGTGSFTGTNPCSPLKKSQSPVVLCVREG